MFFVRDPDSKELSGGLHIWKCGDIQSWLLAQDSQFVFHLFA